jgi:chromosomal replication initiator protein
MVGTEIGKFVPTCSVLKKFLRTDAKATEHYTAVSKDGSMTGNSAEDRDQSNSGTGGHAPAKLEEALRSALSARVGATRFALWFGSKVRLALNRECDSLIVRVPDPFFRDWIERHYTTNLIEAVESVLGHKLGVSVQVHGESEQQPGDVGELESDRSERTDQARSLESFPPRAPGNSRLPVSLERALVLPVSSRNLTPEMERLGRGDGSSRSDSPAPPEISRRPLRRLEDYVGGPGNRLALAAAFEMAQSAGVGCTPLRIPGAIG